MARGVLASAVLRILQNLQAKIGTSSIFNPIPDPGDGAAIPVTHSGSIRLNIEEEESETNSLPAPTFVGQQLAITAETVGGDGERTINATDFIDQSGNLSMIFNEEGDFILLTGTKISGDFRWRIIANLGVSLSGP
jgi:hypothetical protein